MPTIPAQVFDGSTIPELNFISNYSGTIQYAYLSPKTYENVCICRYYANEAKTSFTDAIGKNVYDTNLGSTPYTYDGKSVYYGGGTGQSTEGSYTPPVDKNDVVIPSPDSVKGKIAWLMVYGGYTDGFSNIFAPNKAIKIYVGHIESTIVYWGSVAVYKK